MHAHTSIRVVLPAAVLAFATAWVACSGASSSPAPTTVVLGSTDATGAGSSMTTAGNASGTDLTGRPAGPPAPALTACDQKAESDACSFTNPRGDAVEGTCAARPDDPGQQVCVPNDWRGRGGEGGPPEEVIAACEQKATGDDCSFTGPHGNTVSGTCAEPPGGIPGLLCHSRDETGAGGPRGPRGPNDGADGAPLAACETLSEGTGCRFDAPWGTVTGACRVGRDGESLVCTPADRPGPGR